ncbi:MAG: class I SAM-dependent methyltransferase [Verrucomicrobiae bacterium]|nr:class I SAM-dependent methyltransferase [Verrucomicrobiae bacterium]
MNLKRILKPWPPKHLKKIYQQVPKYGMVLDVGCVGFRQVEIARLSGRHDLKHYGVDYCDLQASAPEGFVFARADLNQEPLPYADDTFDLVVASHIIEHLAKPVEFFGDCLRICKPGGLVYFEAPSERSLMLPGMPFNHDAFHSLSFYDDPTHCSRPWSPQSFHRLAKYYSCEPVEADYLFSWLHRLIWPVTLPVAIIARNGTLFMWTVWQVIGWAAFIIVRKPTKIRGQPPFNYYIPH